MPQPMALYKQLDRDGSVRRWIETARTENKMTAEECGLFLASKALEQVFNEIQDKRVLRDAFDQVWATANNDFRWFADAVDQLKKKTFVMPDGMTNLALVVGFLFWYARRLVKDGKLNETGAKTVMAEIALTMTGVTDTDKRREMRMNAFFDSLFPASG
jgi:hypothetical protein